MSDQVFQLPDLGEGLTEAEIVEWLVDDDAQVSIDQNVVVVETAKATVEVPIPFAGRVSGRHGAVGDVVAVGAPLITVAGSASSSSSAGGGASDEGSGAVLIGYGTGHGQTSRRRRGGARGAAAVAPPAPVVPAPASPVAAPAAVASEASAPAPAAAVSPPETAAPQVISPLVRKLALDHGIDLLSLRPAVGEVLRRSDVEAAISSRPSSSSGPAAAAALPPASATVEASASVEGDERIPLTGLRRVIADKLSTSRREIPDATTWVDVDATGLMSARDALREQGVGLLALLARFCVAGLQQFPELNASVDGDAIVRHKAINLGFAAQSPRGLVVPVVRDAHTLSTRELGAALAELTRRARDGELSPAELTGGTFTLNNYGVFGVDGSTPIINHPEAAMLGVGRIIDRPWVVNGELAVRKVSQLGFTFDHRVCDGGSAGGFLRFVADAVEQPLRLLADC
ncbi:dihydrolipoamide acetyltransferase family protein [Yimella sp. cx-51]|uniref:dihydrolipoamide acetyltransferase family protein n=1 Tax=Yimella sp. cx-51 TaxID=2770551 RepID=UPI00165E46DB|nr:dihydrolipoamide acetyltransferase family protein [Yimella sp. cx-51]MBC9955635.1 2-oxo acid dehydrogenase subunit E2 [Yimella sp. cx-51]QTH37793.1 2-oxo acid dehydrogenase subunit E2 [Yimella sp. cx-51]